MEILVFIILGSMVVFFTWAVFFADTSALLTKIMNRMSRNDKSFSNHQPQSFQQSTTSSIDMKQGEGDPVLAAYLRGYNEGYQRGKSEGFSSGYAGGYSAGETDGRMFH